MQGAGAQRLVALDGLRGWASLSVVVFHLTWETFGGIFPIFRSFPAAFVGNGSFDVALFLMVSGYVLTIRGWRNPDKGGVRRSILKRYFRLTVPILVSVLIFWAVVALGWSHALEAGQIVRRPDWLENFGYFKPDLLAALGFGSFGVYLRTGSQSYGPFLWTMTIEFWGSFVVLVLCWFELPWRWSYVPLGLLVAYALFASYNPYFPIAACYPAGALVALMIRDGLIGAGPPSRLENVVATLIAAATLIAVAIAEITFASIKVTAVLAMVAFVAFLRSAPISGFLALPLSRWLGRLSFPLYLVQISVIVTLTSILIILARHIGALNEATAFGIAAISVAACVLVAQLFMPIERFALDLAARIGELAKRWT